MKLVDILARELKVWPEGAITVDQSTVDREVYTYSANKKLGYTGVFLSVIADDPDEEVTRAQWQAAVDALNESVTWTGAGLPPVGAVCEANITAMFRSEGVWDRAEVIAHTKIGVTNMAVVNSGSSIGWGAAHQFRPIRTPEQIAAEEKGRAVTDMLCIVSGSDLKGRGVINQLEALYDAGYRKQAPE